jgi:hypothetical protein
MRQLQNNESQAISHRWIASSSIRCSLWHFWICFCFLFHCQHRGCQCKTQVRFGIFSFSLFFHCSGVRFCFLFHCQHRGWLRHSSLSTRDPLLLFFIVIAGIKSALFCGNFRICILRINHKNFRICDFLTGMHNLGNLRICCCEIS